MWIMKPERYAATIRILLPEKGLPAGDLLFPFAAYNDHVRSKEGDFMKAHTCCITGHRNTRKDEEGMIRAKIREQILLLLQQGISTFMVGGAVGFDMLAGEVLLDLREKEGKELRLVSVLPYLAWREKWIEEDKDREDRILEKSDEILVSANEYSRHSYLDRDRRMVDSSAVCIAYCARKTGGTAYTVRYALKNGLQVINLADWNIAQLVNTEKPLVF